MIQPPPALKDLDEPVVLDSFDDNLDYEPGDFVGFFPTVDPVTGERTGMMSPLWAMLDTSINLDGESGTLWLGIL